MAKISRWLGRLGGQERVLPRVPDGRCVYAIGDIHGRIDLLDQLLERIWADAPDGANTLVLLGDYVDRGPASKDVVERLINLKRPGWEIVALRGNHEQFLLDYLGKPEIYQAWRSFGGAETLLSYGVRPPIFSNAEEFARANTEFSVKLPPSHLQFFAGLPHAHTVGDYLFVHAGIRPGVALDRQSPDDMMWIREEFLFCEEDFGKIVVHGHTPDAQPAVRTNRIGIDTGAYATNCLTAAKLSGESCMFLSTTGMS
jgi:serine/threonine protein phosphatase 1